MRPPDLAWIDLGSLGPLALAWSQLDAMGYNLPLLVSLGVTWIRLDSCDLVWIHLDSLGHTVSHSASLGLTWVHLASFDLTWSRLVSLGFP